MKRQSTDAGTCHFAFSFILQYWLPDVGRGNKDDRPKFRLEYLTYALPSLQVGGGNGGGSGGDGDGEEELEGERKSGKGGVFQPVPVRELPKSLKNGTRTSSKYAPYGLEDLTIGSWIGFGRQLGDGKEKKLRKTFEGMMRMKAS
jgi:endopolyphosphatase